MSDSRDEFDQAAFAVVSVLATVGGVFAFGLLWMLCLVLCGALCGCSSVLKDLPPGSNVQVSTTGVRVSPQAIDGPLILGQSTYILQTPTPADAGPGLNRSEVQAGFSGVHIKSTVATGSVGEQIQAAGGPEALGVLLPGSRPLVPYPDPFVPTTAGE